MSEEHNNEAGSALGSSDVSAGSSEFVKDGAIAAGSRLQSELAPQTKGYDVADAPEHTVDTQAIAEPLIAVGFGRRFGAWVVDFVLLTLGGMFFSKYLADSMGFLLPLYNAVSAWAVGFVLSGLILVVPLCLREKDIGQGQSVGKQLFGIEIVSLAGGRVSFLPLVAREIVVKFVLPLFLAWLCLYLHWLSGSQATNLIAFVVLVDCLWSVSFAGRALHDIVCSTRVVRHIEQPVPAELDCNVPV